MTLVKIFSDENLDLLESQINNWKRARKKRILSASISVVPGGNGHSVNYLAIVTYDDGEPGV